MTGAIEAEDPSEGRRAYVNVDGLDPIANTLHRFAEQEVV
jgi:hypothetical protein